MNEKTVVEQSIGLLKDNGVRFGDGLQSALDEAESPIYKIAVVGRYQTGKTTLINKVFLKEDFLATGCGLCKTSVVTKLSNGTNKKVVLVKRTESGDLSPEEMTEPTAKKIEEITTSENNEGRLALAKSVSEVQVEWPCQSLKNFVIYDTPGIDDPIEELLDETTYRVLPAADLVVMVVESKQLSQQEKVFLSHKIFKNGLKRVMILVSYNPAQPQSASMREGIVSSIRGQLRELGREYIPVYVCTYDDKVSGDVLNTPDAIEKTILNFLDQNASLAREEKIRYALAYELMQLRNGMAARISVNGKTDAEIADIQKQVKEVGDTLEVKYKGIVSAFKGEYYTFKDDVKEFASKSLERAQSQVMVEVEAKEDFAALKDAIPAISAKAKSEFESALVEINTFATGRLKDILTQKQSDLEAVAKELVLPTAMSVDVNVGWVGKLNPKILIVSEYALMWWLLGGPLGAGIRYATAFVPGLKKLLPSNFAKGAVVKAVRESLQRNYDDILYLVGDSLDETQGYISKAIADKFVELHKLTCAPYDEAIKAASGKKLSDDEVDKLQSVIAHTDELITNLK